MTSVRVPNFLPSMSAFHFPNAFSGSADVSDIVLNLPVFGNVPLGTPADGLCGGLVFSVIDFVNAQPPVLMLPDLGVPNPPIASPLTPGDPLFNYLLQRLLDTFVLGEVGPKTLLWMELPTHDTWFSWLTGHGIAWLMVEQEWPAIQSDLDNGNLSPIGLVSNNLFTCHQVLAHGYDLDDQGNLIIYCYDPNEPSQDGAATLNLNISQTYNTIPIQSNNISANDETGTVVFFGIFHASYTSAHFAAELTGPFSIGQIPPNAEALQSLAPAWNAWESPFSSLFLSAAVTLQNPAAYLGAPLGGPYAPLGANPATAPSVCSSGQNRLDLFVQDQNGFANHLFWDNGNVGIDQLQQPVVSCPCAIAWGSGRADGFAVLNDLDYSLVHFWVNGGQLQQSESLGRPFGNWNTTPIPLDGSAESAVILGLSEGYYFASPPCACTWGTGRMDIFAFANRWNPESGEQVNRNDARIAHLAYNGSWSPWERVPLPGGITVAEGTSPMAVSWALGRIDLFVIDTRSGVWHASFSTDSAGNNGIWSAWENLGFPASGFGQMQPSVVSWGPGSLDVFGIGEDGHLYHQWYDTTSTGTGHWANAWEDLGCPPTGNLQGSATVCSWASGRLDVFARGTDVDTKSNKVPALWHLWFDGESWRDHSWESLGGVIQSDPVAATWGPNRIDLFAAGGNIFSLGSDDFVPWHVWFQS